MPRRRVSRGRTGSRRKLVWARRSTAQTIQGTGIALDLLAQFETDLGSDLVGCTVRRIILDLNVQITTLATGTNDLFYGILVTDSDHGPQLAATGVTNVDSRHRDWMWFGQTSPSDVVPVAGTEWSYHADVRVGRKMEEINQELFLVFEPALSAVYQSSLTTSVLLALP